jgi:phospholipase C
MIQKYARGAAAVLTSACLVLSSAGPAWADRRSEADSYQTTTPIKHVVVIFQENVSFDHYFASYPHATNPTGEPGLPCPARHSARQQPARRRIAG